MEAMPRSARIAPGGMVYHVINRAVGKMRLFRDEGDFPAFHKIIRDTLQRIPTRLLGWCVMPNHWHFVVWPREDGELSRFFRHLALTHATRWQLAHDAVGAGHVYQGRFKSFLIQEDDHLETVLRYVERNPLRANLVKRAQDWRWSSLHAGSRGTDEDRRMLSDWPIQRRPDWAEFVNAPQTPAEEEAIALCIRRDRPMGDARWLERIVARHGLARTLRPQGRQPGWRKAPPK